MIIGTDVLQAPPKKRQQIDTAKFRAGLLGAKTWEEAMQYPTMNEYLDRGRDNC